MPKSLDATKDFAIILDSDMQKPIESRPTFYARAMTMRQQIDFSEAIDDAMQAQTTEELFDRNCELLSSKITRWTNMGEYEFGKTDLRDLLGFDEARELLRKVQANSHVTIEEKKS